MPSICIYLLLSRIPLLSKLLLCARHECVAGEWKTKKFNRKKFRSNKLHTVQDVRNFSHMGNYYRSLADTPKIFLNGWLCVALRASSSLSLLSSSIRWRWQQTSNTIRFKLSERIYNKCKWLKREMLENFPFFILFTNVSLNAEVNNNWIQRIGANINRMWIVEAWKMCL